MTTIGIDARFASVPTGLGRYTRELVPRLLARNDGQRYVVFGPATAKAWLETLPNCAVRMTDIRHYSPAEQFLMPRVLYKESLDLLFSLHFNVPLYAGVPSVVTIHDLILHRYPNDASFLRRAAYRFLMQRAVRKASAIIAVSDFTKSELSAVYGPSVAAKTTVVHEGVAPLFRARDEDEQRRVQERLGLSAPFFLYIGNAKQHKNVPMLLDAFSRLPDDGTELILVSGGPEADRLTLPSRVRILRAVDDADLPALYSAARAFVTASLYEGFCLPLLEAAACGCPIVAVRGSAVTEVAPAGSVLVGATPEELVTALQQVPQRTGQVGTFRTWEDCAAQTAQVLQRAL